jgi:hypothetical protein
MTPAGWKVTAFTPTGPVVAWSCWFYDYIELIAPAGQAPLEGARPVYDLPVWRASSWMRPSYPRVLCGQILGVVHSEPTDEKPYQRLIYGVQGEPRSQAYLDLEPVAFSAFAAAAATATRLVYEPASYGFPNPEQLEAMGADICDLKGHRQGATHGDDQFAVHVLGHTGFYSSANSVATWSSYWLQEKAPDCGADVANYLNTLRTLSRREEPAEIEA